MPSHSPLENLTPAKLAQLLDVKAVSAAAWTGEDAAAILRHQLAAPLLPDLLLVPGVEADRLRSLTRNQPNATTFLELLTSSQPSIDLLQAAKHFARHVHADNENPLHGNPADILYFAAIAAALLRCNTRITKLDEGQLRAAFTWTLEQRGAESLADLLRESLVMLVP